jgi:hypothetical protein
MTKKRYKVYATVSTFVGANSKEEAMDILSDRGERAFMYIMFDKNFKIEEVK